MEFVFDLNRLCSELKKVDEDVGVREFCKTSGERYLYNNVVKPCVSGVELRFRDIDFDAFDEDDIANIIDERDEEIDMELCTVQRLVESFANGSALSAKKKKFFRRQK